MELLKQFQLEGEAGEDPPSSQTGECQDTQGLGFLSYVSPCLCARHCVESLATLRGGGGMMRGGDPGKLTICDRAEDICQAQDVGDDVQGAELLTHYKSSNECQSPFAPGPV